MYFLHKDINEFHGLASLNATVWQEKRWNLGFPKKYLILDFPNATSWNCENVENFETCFLELWERENV